MKNSNEQIDKIIHEALTQEEAKFYDQLGEQSILEMSIGVFKGKNRGIYLLTFIMSFVLFGVFVFCAIEFYNAETTKEMLLFGGIGFWCMIGVTATKMWYWMQMNTNSILREMKRLELQIAALTNEK
jgi:hypothetical protein